MEYITGKIFTAYCRGVTDVPFVNTSQYRCNWGSTVQSFDLIGGLKVVSNPCKIGQNSFDNNLC